jgi:hypothetical protein
MGTKINIPVYVDCYLTEGGIGLYVSTDSDGFSETIISFKALMKDYIETNQIPSTPRTMHDEDRPKIHELCDTILEAVDYLRKLEHDTPTWKNRMGHRD